MRHDVMKEAVRYDWSRAILLLQPAGEAGVLQFELFWPLTLKALQVLKLPADSRKFAQVRDVQQDPFGFRFDQ